jgi:predicted PurR-regulated permease PerM
MSAVRVNQSMHAPSNGLMTADTQPSRYTIAAWILTAVLLVLVLRLELVVAFLSGLLVYEIVRVVAPRLPGRRDGRMGAVALVAAIVVLLLAGAIFGIAGFLRSEAGSVHGLTEAMESIIDSARSKLPEWVLAYLPADPGALKHEVVEWMREHSAELRGVGGTVGHAAVHLIIGMVIGAMVCLHDQRDAEDPRPLARALRQRAVRVGDAFRRVVFAQVRISAINTVFTALYLLAALPLFGVHLPFTKTLVVLTFVAGMLPVVGNLISNGVILLVSLSVSLETAMASLVFLLVIHKLEYFLNARIVGGHIHARPWELLLAMLVMEAAFGLPGLAVAPVYYAYLKDELASRGLV